MTNSSEIEFIRYPLNSRYPKKLFDKFKYKRYRPKLIFFNGSVTVTRIGIMYYKFLPVYSAHYANPYVFIRSIIISIASLLKRGVKKMNSTQYIIVHSPWTNGYYHWITEVIPKIIFAVDNYGTNIKVLLPYPDISKNFLETLKLLGIENVTYFPNDKNVTVKDPIAISSPRSFGTTDPYLLKRMRSIYLNKVRSVNIHNYNFDKIYISRSMSRGRKVHNESEVVSLLKEYGFSVLNFEMIPFSLQVKIISNARFLVGIHGAGLTNMIFMKEGSSVLELVPQKNLFFDYNIVRFSIKHDPCYLRLASAMGHDYYIEICKTINDRGFGTHMSDIIVDLHSLKNTIEFMLKK